MNQAATAMDLDPLNTYEYPYTNYPVNNIQQPYPYNVKIEDALYYGQNNQSNAVFSNNMNQQSSGDQPEQATEEMKPVVNPRKKVNKRGLSSQKINDATFPFYGCSLCNISFLTLNELDQHVTIHKNRMTSYRLRLRNQFKKKQMKKEKKKLKKLQKIKKEVDLEIEIKPEDGYIGNEKAVDYNNMNNEMQAIENIEISMKITETTETDLDSSQNSEMAIGVNHNSEIRIGSLENAEKAVGLENNKINIGSIDNTETEMKTIEKTISNTNSVPNSNINSLNGSKFVKNSECKNSCVNDANLDKMEKIYKCFACQKQFTLSYYLKLHVRSHTDEKPYICSACGQSFITASKLGRHNKRIHLASRFQCRICFKTFSRFDLLTTHFDKHHSEDKLEGEPYDYNAILPYLTDLERQLIDQSDEKEQKVDEFSVDPGETVPPEVIKEETQESTIIEVPPKIEIIVEELKLNNYETEVKVKMEVENNDANVSSPAAGDQVPCEDSKNVDDDDVKSEDLNNDDVKNHDFDFNKDDSFSDEDYFPANTWAATPKCDPSPPPSPKHKKNPVKIVKCEICNKEISSLSYMRIHMRTHTGEKPFKCFTCNRAFITSSKLHRHILTHGLLVKPDDVKFDDDVKAEGDVVNSDVGGDSESSKSTIKKFKKKKGSNTEGKVRKKQQKRPHCCEYCNQRFLHLHMLEIHRKCHSGEELVLKCQFCLEEAEDVTSLRTHEATHSGPKRYLCTICGKNYKKRETMIYHRKRHQPESEFICDVCSKRFNEAGKLAKHMRTHNTEKFMLRYECPVCAHMFNTKYHVEMHLATHQKEGLILESNRSEVLAMVLQNALKIPKQSDAAITLNDNPPTNQRYCICKICGETFHHFYYLEEHLKSHGSKIAIDNTNQAEEKKYICEVCNKAFKLHYYLKLHSFTHSKEKPFICQQCGKGFITKGKLKRHLETHTGLKKYQCHICYKFFTRPSYLRIHVRTIHGTQDYNFRFDKSCMSLSDMSALTQISDSQNSI